MKRIGETTLRLVADRRPIRTLNDGVVSVSEEVVTLVQSVVERGDFDKRQFVINDANELVPDTTVGSGWLVEERFEMSKS